MDKYIYMCIYIYISILTDELVSRSRSDKAMEKDHNLLVRMRKIKEGNEEERKNGIAWQRMSSHKLKQLKY